MAVSIEAHVPLLDHRIFEFVLKLPEHMKIQRGRTRWFNPKSVLMEMLVSILEQHCSSPVVLRRLCYLLHGANLLQGYRQGLPEFRLAGAQE